MTLAARLILGVVFVAAGTAKLTIAGRRSFARGLRGFGVAPRLVRPLTAAIPFLEVALGSLLLAGLATRAAALAVLALVVAFSAAVARALLRGERVDCGCFGAAAARQVGPGTLLRNVVLATLAALAAREAAWTAPWGPPGRVLPVVLLSAGVLAAAAVVGHLDRLRAAPPRNERAHP